ncbi:MAG TPA: endonuclease MutS2 [Terriglobia bacterium]|nr:endonuclease MutS2 [Terriglobia bacterium]
MTPEYNCELLEFRALIGIIIQLSDSPLGVQVIERLAPLTQPSEIQKQLALIGEWLQLMEAGQNPCFDGIEDCASIFEKLRIGGTLLETQEILSLTRLLHAGRVSKSLLQKAGSGCPNLQALERQIPQLNQLIVSIEGKINETGEVDDNASPELRRLRKEVITLRGRLYRSLEDISRRLNGAQVLQDEVITVRNERFVVPVRAEKRKELTGVVHGTSSSGLTVFVEPLETIELNNHMVRLQEEVSEEIRRILGFLTQQLREHLDQLLQTHEVLGLLDSLQARARFHKKHRCTLPSINKDGVLTLVEGRHPILENALQTQGKEVVPISVQLNHSRQILIISGPNTGGKTVALKTVGLLTLMALSGIPVPAEFADCCVFHQVLADIGDRQSIAENLSTFSSHLINIRDILEKVSPPALVLLDELGTGTDPAEGSALGVAIVDSLRSKGAITVATTHHNGLKMYASRTPGVSNGSMEFDQATLQPTFRLLHGFPGNSSGIEVARRLGLEEALLDYARSQISEDEISIARFSRQLHEQIDSVRQTQEQLSVELRQLKERRAALELEHRQLIEDERQRVGQHWQRAFQTFEQETRQLLAEVKDKFLAVKARREIERKTARLREHAQSELDRPTEPGGTALPTVRVDCGRQLKPGVKVQVKRFGQPGMVIAAHKEDQWEVAVGNMKCVLSAAELELTGSVEPDSSLERSAPSHITVRLNTPELAGNELNLVGCTVEDAIRRTDKFLDQAFLASITSVRLIHGYGMGILKKAISEWLSSQPYVEEFHPAPPGEGGKAVTVVSLKS